MKFEFPKSLPINDRLDELKALFESNQVIVVAGETGSGKTTQLPKICLQLGWANSAPIAHTQPRRIAARSVSERIAEELNVKLGEEVGYQVRFKDLSSEQTQLKLLTDGVLLQELRHDPLLKKYSAVIVDEAHERSLNIDLVLGLLKRVIKKRRDFKLIITSATIDLERFAEFFAVDGKPAPIIEVSGRTYPVELIYQESDTQIDLAENISNTVEEIIEGERRNLFNTSGDILVFCSGEREIREAQQILSRRFNSLNIVPLYARLSLSDQRAVFKPSKQRKVVLATNVAETSITVPGIAYVIDPGKARISRYSFRSKVQRLPIEKISKASAQQRAGRCGRVSNGVCFRLYSESDYEAREAFTPPEIMRSNLASVILQMLRIGIKDVHSFEFMEAPDRRLLNDGFKLLQELGGVNSKHELTAVGRQMSELSVDPKFARILIHAKASACLRDAIVLVSALSLRDVREVPTDQKAKSEQLHRLWLHPKSEFMSLLILWQLLSQSKDTLSNSRFKKLCAQHYWSISRVFEWRELVGQLIRQCKALKWQIEDWQPLELPREFSSLDELGNSQLVKNKRFDVSMNARYESVHKALLSGLILNLLQKDEKDQYRGTRGRSLSLFPGNWIKPKGEWLLAAEMLETSKVFALTVARINPQWAIEAAPHLCRYSYDSPSYHVRAGDIRANRKTLIYGLVVRPKQSVRYNKINSKESREIFIQSALIEGKYQPSNAVAKFVETNKQTLDDIEKLEAKSRRRNLSLSDAMLGRFFDERLPMEINSRQALEAWLAQGNQDALVLDRAELMQSQDQTDLQGQFPNKLRVQGKDVKLHYRFTPGDEHDGLSIDLPVSLLPFFPPHLGDWLVPGLLQEKCAALIKSLPKPLRRQIGPASQAAGQVLAQLHYQDQALTQALAEALFRSRGVKVMAEDFQAEKLEPFYFLNYRLLDENKSILKQGRDLTALKAEYAEQVSASVKATHSSARDKFQKRDLATWNFGDLPNDHQYQHLGMMVTAYPMLKQNLRGSVDLLLHDSAAEARFHTHRAIAVLASISEQAAQSKKYLQKEILRVQKQQKVALSNLAQQLSKAAIKDEERDYWRQELIIAGLIEVCFPNKLNLVRTQAEFDAALDDGIKDWVSTSMALEVSWQNAWNQKEAILNTLNSTELVKLDQDAAAEEIKQQLYRLFDPTILRVLRHEHLKHYPRYLKAIEQRIDKGYVASSAEMRREFNRFESLLSELDPNSLGLEYVFFNQPKLLELWLMLEEWRVSAFAQSLKTRFPVSAKRIEKFWVEQIAPALP